MPSRVGKASASHTHLFSPYFGWTYLSTSHCHQDHSAIPSSQCFFGPEIMWNSFQVPIGFICQPFTNQLMSCKSMDYHPLRKNNHIGDVWWCFISYLLPQPHHTPPSNHHLLGGSSQLVSGLKNRPLSRLSRVVAPFPNGLLMAYKRGLRAYYLHPLGWSSILQPTRPGVFVLHRSLRICHLWTESEVSWGDDVKLQNTGTG